MNKQILLLCLIFNITQQSLLYSYNNTVKSYFNLDLNELKPYKSKLVAMTLLTLIVIKYNKKIRKSFRSCIRGLKSHKNTKKHSVDKPNINRVEAKKDQIVKKKDYDATPLGSERQKNTCFKPNYENNKTIGTSKLKSYSTSNKFAILGEELE